VAEAASFRESNETRCRSWHGNATSSQPATCGAPCSTTSA